MDHTELFPAPGEKYSGLLTPQALNNCILLCRLISVDCYFFLAWLNFCYDDPDQFVNIQGEYIITLRPSNKIKFKRPSLIMLCSHMSCANLYWKRGRSFRNQRYENVYN